MPVITQSFGKVTILSERVFFESLSLSIGYNLFIVAIIYCNPPNRVGFVATLSPKL
jgi:hypothetical protein